ncbi:hypothetical protein HJG60_009371 [Phyllostomus discolor]|uniref:Uncharacterized protein n=1 Tax=Phyllostomus discolor TaxID=89673 RepID=A0A834DC07_9CHIR|nr:hypothetical protein HJG60_009371 [Phyllostomus discolor]
MAVGSHRGWRQGAMGTQAPPSGGRGDAEVSRLCVATSLFPRPRMSSPALPLPVETRRTLPPPGWVLESSLGRGWRPPGGGRGSGARRRATFPLFSLGSELCWDAVGSASPLEPRPRCQGLQALAAGQRGPPSPAGLGKPQESDMLRHNFQQLHHLPREKHPLALISDPHLQGANVEMPPPPPLWVALGKHVQNQSQDLGFIPHSQVS